MEDAVCRFFERIGFCEESVFRRLSHCDPNGTVTLELPSYVCTDTCANCFLRLYPVIFI